MISPARSSPFKWTVCHRKGAVVTVPVTVEGKFVLVRQERVPIKSELWEFPAGQIDDIEEPNAIQATAVREMEEEVGYTLAPGGELIPLGHFFPSAGFTDEHSHLVLARPVIPSVHGNKPDSGEAIIATGLFTLEQLQAMVAQGEICDANTLAAFARILALGLFRL
jgi:8-oxo-dGTP pyrophosphatase MutT (NUDIX family)